MLDSGSLCYAGAQGLLKNIKVVTLGAADGHGKQSQTAVDAEALSVVNSDEENEINIEFQMRKDEFNTRLSSFLRLCIDQGSVSGLSLPHVRQRLAVSSSSALS